MTRDFENFAYGVIFGLSFCVIAMVVSATIFGNDCRVGEKRGGVGLITKQAEIREGTN